MSARRNSVILAVLHVLSSYFIICLLNAGSVGNATDNESVADRAVSFVVISGQIEVIDEGGDLHRVE